MTKSLLDARNVVQCDKRLPFQVVRFNDVMIVHDQMQAGTFVSTLISRHWATEQEQIYQLSKDDKKRITQ